jgi:hypothetical protein
MFLNCDAAPIHQQNSIACAIAGSVVFGKTRRSLSDAPALLRIDADSPAPDALSRVRRKMDAWRGDAIVGARVF